MPALVSLKSSAVKCASASSRLFAARALVAAEREAEGQ
jgi:hypothetical protein